MSLMSPVSLVTPGPGSLGQERLGDRSQAQDAFLLGFRAGLRGVACPAVAAVGLIDNRGLSGATRVTSEDLPGDRLEDSQRPVIGQHRHDRTDEPVRDQAAGRGERTQGRILTLRVVGSRRTPLAATGAQRDPLLAVLSRWARTAQISGSVAA